MRKLKAIKNPRKKKSAPPRPRIEVIERRDGPDFITPYWKDRARAAKDRGPQADWR